MSEELCSHSGSAMSSVAWEDRNICAERGQHVSTARARPVTPRQLWRFWLAPTQILRLCTEMIEDWLGSQTSCMRQRGHVSTVFIRTESFYRDSQCFARKSGVPVCAAHLALFAKPVSYGPAKAEQGSGAVHYCCCILLGPHCVRAFDATRRPAAEMSGTSYWAEAKLPSVRPVSPCILCFRLRTR